MSTSLSFSANGSGASNHVWPSRLNRPMAGRPAAAGGSGVAGSASASSSSSAIVEFGGGRHDRVNKGRRSAAVDGAGCPSRDERRDSSSCARSLAWWALAREACETRVSSSWAAAGGEGGCPSRSERRYASSWARSRARWAWSSAACDGGSHGNPCSLRGDQSMGGESLSGLAAGGGSCPLPSGPVCAAWETHVSTSRSAFGGGGPVELAAGQEGVCSAVP